MANLQYLIVNDARDCQSRHCNLQGFAGWMQQKTICEEELTNALGHVLQILLFVNSYRIEALQFGQKTQQDVRCGMIEFSFYSAQSVLFGS